MLAAMRRASSQGEPPNGGPLSVILDQVAGRRRILGGMLRISPTLIRDGE